MSDLDITIYFKRGENREKMVYSEKNAFFCKRHNKFTWLKCNIQSLFEWRLLMNFEVILYKEMVSFLKEYNRIGDMKDIKIDQFGNMTMVEEVHKEITYVY